ncbi:hypothetical protein ACET3Z_000065 [Daucus carota]
MQAFVYADNWTALSKKIEIKEGCLYAITNFYAKEAFGSLRPVSTKKLINFSNSTILEKIDLDDHMIPMHKFEFVDLGDLLSLAKSYSDKENPEFSTGVIENYENVQEIDTVNGPRNIVKFRITDGRKVNVTVWGDLALTAQEEKQKAGDTTIIVILASTKLKIYKNTVQINTVPSSKIYMNLHIDSVIAMRQRSFTLVISVEENGWWCNSCGGCETEVEKQAGKFFCKNCNHCIPVAEKRYRVVILGEDTTEAYNFVLMDRGVKRMLGVTATKMISDKLRNQTANDFPPEIKALTGKELKLKVLINEDNVKANSRLFFAVDVCDAAASSSAMCSVSGTSSTTDTNGDVRFMHLIRKRL